MTGDRGTRCRGVWAGSAGQPSRSEAGRGGAVHAVGDRVAGTSRTAGPGRSGCLDGAAARGAGACGGLPRALGLRPDRPGGGVVGAARGGRGGGRGTGSGGACYAVRFGGFPGGRAGPARGGRRLGWAGSADGSARGLRPAASGAAGRRGPRGARGAVPAALRRGPRPDRARLGTGADDLSGPGRAALERGGEDPPPHVCAEGPRLAGPRAGRPVHPGCGPSRGGRTCRQAAFPAASGTSAAEYSADFTGASVTAVGFGTALPA